MPALEHELAGYCRVELNKRFKSAPSVLFAGDFDRQDFYDGVVSAATVWSVPTMESSFDDGFDAVVVNGGHYTLGVNVEPLLRRLLLALKSDGVALIRLDLANSTTNVAKYTHYFDEFRMEMPNESGSLLGFKFEWVRNVETSIFERHSWKDFCWCLSRTEFKQTADSSDAPKSERDFLDRNQYLEDHVKIYEFMFGSGFISPGGAESNLGFVKTLELKPNRRMLDVGCGIGGSLFQVAKQYGCFIDGVDLSSNMLAESYETADTVKDHRIRCFIADILDYDFPESTYDVIYSRDCIQHISNKWLLFHRFLRWLKPGGRLLVTSYTRGDGEATDEFKKYVAKRHYTLEPLSSYVQKCEMAGFEQVKGTDLTDNFKDILTVEMKKLESNKVDFLKQFSQKDYDDLMNGWSAKLRFIAAKNHCWTMCTAVKPSS